LIAAGVHGISQRMDPGAPLEEDAGAFSNQELEALGIDWIPRNFIVQAACAPHNSSTILIFSFHKANLIVETNMKVSCTGTHHYVPSVKQI